MQDKHLKSIKALAEENICKRYFVVSGDSIKRKIGNIEMLHWQDFLQLLWEEKIF